MRRLLQIATVQLLTLVSLWKSLPTQMLIVSSNGIFLNKDSKSKLAM